MKKVVSLLLVAMLFVALVPSAAFAETLISDVSFFVETPLAGCSPATTFTAKNNTNSVALTNVNILWYKLNKSTYAFESMETTEKFTKGNFYRALMVVRPASGYFDGGEKTNRFTYYEGKYTVNGQTPSNDDFNLSSAYGTTNSSYSRCLVAYYTFGELKETTLITSVTVTGVQTPVIGEPCSVSSIKITSDRGENAYTVTELYWVDETADYYHAKPQDTFVEGHKYSIFITLMPKSGYDFIKASEGYFSGERTINGENAWAQRITGGISLRSDPVMAVKPTMITTVKVTGVPTPVVGAPCTVDTVKVQTDPANAFVTSGENKAYIYWYDETAKRELTNSDTFIKDHEYHLSIELFPKSGYAFPFLYEVYSGLALVDGKTPGRTMELNGSWLFLTGDWSLIPVEALPGDVNMDGKVNAADALLTLKAAVGKTTLTTAQTAAADVNKDGKVNASDALQILKKAVGKPACF